MLRFFSILASCLFVVKLMNYCISLFGENKTIYFNHQSSPIILHKTNVHVANAREPFHNECVLVTSKQNVLSLSLSLYLVVAASFMFLLISVTVWRLCYSLRKKTFVAFSFNCYRKTSIFTSSLPRLLVFMFLISVFNQFYSFFSVIRYKEKKRLYEGWIGFCLTRRLRLQVAAEMLIIQNSEPTMGSYDDAALGLNDAVNDSFRFVHRWEFLGLRRDKITTEWSHSPMSIFDDTHRCYSLMSNKDVTGH